MQRATSIWRRFLRLLPLVVYLLLSQAQGVPLHPGSSPETMLQPDSLRFSSDSSRAEQFYPDNSPVDIKVPSRKVVDSLKKDRDFSYLRTVARDDSWWIRFWEWLGSLFTRAASDSSGFDLWGILFTRILPWTVALAAIVLVVMKLMGVDIDSLIRKKAVSPTVIFEENAGDIDPGDFEQRLETALEQRNLRQAIRIYYLEILKQLSRDGHIQWHPDKTNRHYLQEIPTGDMQDRFGRLTRIFEYIWYGEATPRDQDLEAVQVEFAALKKTIGQE